MDTSISNRKEEHIVQALKPENQGPLSTHLEDVILIHQPLVEVSYDEVSLETEFLGYRLGAPIIISSMTGGTAMSYDINKKLASTAEKYKLAIGVGSQRAMIVNPDTTYTYRVVREEAPNVPVIANIGLAQLSKLSKQDIERIVEAIEADALAVHLNILQEIVQPEGDRDFRGSVKALEKIIEWINIPVIVKEVGTGISRECAELLKMIGVKIIDVAGAGGTNWVSIELSRIKDKKLVDTFNVFRYWGIPTAISIAEVSSIDDITVIGSGGIRDGLDIAKAISLGSDIVGIAQPFLIHVIKNTVDDYVQSILTQLKVSMMLTGSKNIQELKNAKIVITGKLATWICARRLRLRNKYAYISCLT